MSIENILAELIAAVKENTAALMSARVEAVVAEAQVSTGSMLIDKTDEQRESEKPTTVEENKSLLDYAKLAAVADVTAQCEAESLNEPQGDPEAIVDKASAAYDEMKKAVLDVARMQPNGKERAVAILAEFGIAKMTEAKNKDVAAITTKMRAALDA